MPKSSAPIRRVARASPAARPIATPSREDAKPGRCIDGPAIVAEAKADPLVGEYASAQLTHFCSTTREPSDHHGRITALIESGRLFDALGVPPLDPETDRAMICGSMDMIQDTKALMLKAGLREGDVVVKVNGSDVTPDQTLSYLIANSPVGAMATGIVTSWPIMRARMLRFSMLTATR